MDPSIFVVEAALWGTAQRCCVWLQLCIALHLPVSCQLHTTIHNGIEHRIISIIDFWAREFPKTCMPTASLFCVNVIHCNTCGANVSASTEQWPKLPKIERTMKVVADCISCLKGAMNLSKVIAVPNCGSYSWANVLDILSFTNFTCIWPIQGISSKLCICNLDPEMVRERNSESLVYIISTGLIRGCSLGQFNVQFVVVCSLIYQLFISVSLFWAPVYPTMECHRGFELCSTGTNALEAIWFRRSKTLWHHQASRSMNSCFYTEAYLDTAPQGLLQF